MKDTELNELQMQARSFVSSELGKYFLDGTKALREGHMSSARNMAVADPVRFLDRATGIEEAEALINNLLD